jgi:hypothetical protein
VQGVGKGWSVKQGIACWDQGRKASLACNAVGRAAHCPGLVKLGGAQFVVGLCTQSVSAGEKCRDSRIVSVAWSRSEARVKIRKKNPSTHLSALTIATPSCDLLETQRVVAFSAAFTEVEIGGVDLRM